QGERHHLGQYFTSADVADLILSFCVGSARDLVIDPSCGAGSFLVRAAARKRNLDPGAAPADLLATLWGVELAAVPAQLAMVNLAIHGGLGDAGDGVRPHIIRGDFFGASLPEGRFDAVVGNPPYTRHPTTPVPPVPAISGRAGLYTHFFFHAMKLLRDGGQFGFVVPSAWLDAAHGMGLKGFLLENTCIETIIESKVERWFADADTNTCIVILRRTRAKALRDENVVRFVQLKRRLAEIIPGSERDDERERWRALSELRAAILSPLRPWEDDTLKIVPKCQNELGLDRNRKEGCVGSGSRDKWGQFIRAPGVFSELVRAAKDRLVRLGDLVAIKRGIKTGADPWFYVTDVSKDASGSQARRLVEASGIPCKGKVCLVRSGDGTIWPIEERYLRPVARSPEGFERIGIAVRSIADRVVVLDEPAPALAGTLAWRYVRHGETQSYAMGKGRRAIPAQAKTCAGREPWFRLPRTESSRILWQMAIDRSHGHYLADRPLLSNQRFFAVVPRDDDETLLVAALLNSVTTAIPLEFQRAVLGLGAVEATVDEVGDLLVANPEIVDRAARTTMEQAILSLAQRPLGTVFDELCASDSASVTLENVKSDRRALDRALVCGVLGQEECVLLEIYRALVDLVAARIAKARSARK
ncbi:MAG: N-6 DNA methylase, partial [Deltaproteobacteria bacterium]|nr:N-6 DNA methylase [Deltaproteobacteria bacterium]